MLRLALPCLLFVGSCTPPAPVASDLAAGQFAGEGRNALCLSEAAAVRRAGVIVYGKGDANCAMRGMVEQAEGGPFLVPDGESECRVALTATPTGVALGRAPAACAYYCGPGASFDGATFRRIEPGKAITSQSRPSDFAGDPLC